MTTAVGIIAVLAWIFPLQRSYWAVITVMSVLCQTWGESIHKGLKRIWATLAGLLVGVLLEMVIQHRPVAIFAVLILSIFLMSYLISRAYTHAVFWMSIMIVMLFSLIGRFSWMLALERAYETLVGAAVAGLVALTVFPARARGRLRVSTSAYLQLLRTSYNDLMYFILHPETERPPPRDSRLIQQLEQLHHDYRAFRREMLFQLRSPRRRQRWLVYLESIQLNITAMYPIRLAVHNGQMLRSLHHELAAIQERLDHNFGMLLAVFEGTRKPQDLDLRDIEDIRNGVSGKLMELLNNRETFRDACLVILPVFYYSLRINRTLRDMAADIRERWA